MNGWARTVWLEGECEEEGVIPCCWIKDDVVFWPSGVNVLRAMSERRQPTDKWRKFKLVKVKMSSSK